MKIAITGLVRGYSDTHFYHCYYNQQPGLIERNKAIYDIIYKNNESKYDIILFHEGNISEEHKEYIQKHTPELPLQFINISSEFDSSLVKTTSKYCIPREDPIYCTGYKHMCRFWTYGFFKYVDNYETIVRIDEDCIVKEFSNKIFNEMILNDIVYVTGHIYNIEDEPYYTQGIKEMTLDFIKDTNLQCTPLYDYNPYTNFIIIRPTIIQQTRLFKKWCDTIEEAGGIYMNRWGDLPLWGITLSLFFPKNNIFVDGRIKYYHGSHDMNIN